MYVREKAKVMVRRYFGLELLFGIVQEPLEEVVIIVTSCIDEVAILRQLCLGGPRLTPPQAWPGVLQCSNC